MSDTNISRKCCMPGCGTSVPEELETDTLCVSHFLSTAENACAAIRREAIPGGPDVPRRLEIENFVAASAIKLARIGTGSARLTDETKKRVLTTFLTLMILRENLERTSNCFQPRRAAAKVETPSELVAA
ncbi:MAG TPA: hypothetical protein VKT71_12005 [Candidatus Acidoferrales bacterium]|nr:hypothetical protein [Candidatus Acidoferrales bacterium]